jgi:putative Ca2+/H+ antiporter (TMEM165/GDT1 family)
MPLVIPVGGTDRGKAFMSYLAVIGVAFAITFLAELPDRSMFASLVLGTRYRPAWVWTGAAVAFAVHMAIAVTAGQLLALLPHAAVQGVIAGLFLAGSAYLWVSSFRPGRRDGVDAARQGGPPASFLRVAAMSFSVVFLAEWGDITQVTVANLTARYAPLPVFADATLGLWAIAAAAIGLGAKSLDLIPIPWIRRITATILLCFGAYTIVAAITG